MNNNLIGITLSALLHAGLFSWAIALNKPLETIKPPTENKHVLSVKLFQTKVLTPPPAAIVKTVKKAPEAPTAAPIKVAALAPPVIKQTKNQPEPSPKIIIEKKQVEEPEKIKVTPPKPIIAKVKPKIKKPARIKPKKRLLKKKVKKPTPVKIKPKRRVVKKTPQRKKVVARKKKIIVKRQLPRQKRVPVRQPQKALAVRTPIKRPRQAARPSQHKRVVPAKNIRPRYSKQTNRQQILKQHRRAASPPAPVNTPINANLRKQYKARLQQLIASKKRYPKRAKRRGQQGRVTLSFKITHSGVISNIRIIKGSNSKALDSAAIKAVKQASGRLTYLNGMSKKSMMLQITLAYKLS